MAVEYFALLTGIMGFAVLLAKAGKAWKGWNVCRVCVCGWLGLFHVALSLVGLVHLDHNILAGFSAACILWIIGLRSNAAA